MTIKFEIDRRRRAVRSTMKPRIGELGKADGTLYLDDHTRLWARWSGSKNANGDATYSQPFAVYPGSSNYLPEAGRQVYIGKRYGKLTVLDAVPDDLIKAGVDLRGLNPNDPYRQFVYTVNFVPLRSDALANEGEDSLKVNLNQLLYLDSYGDYKLWNGTDENTHINFAAVQAAMSADEHALGIVALKTFENEPQSVASTPQDINTPLDLTDLQECKDQLDAETVDSRVYRITSDMVTLIANPTTDWDLRQWLNMPPRLGNPNPVTKHERVRAGHQLVYYGFVGATTGSMEALGEVMALDDGAAETGGMTSFNVTADTGSTTVDDGETLDIDGGSGIDTSLTGLMLTIALDATVIRTTGTQSIGAGLTIDTPAIANLTNMQHDHTDADDGGQLTDAALSAPVGIAKGGTGQTSQTPAFDALAPTTTKGDLIVSNGSDNVRKAVGANGTELIADSVASEGVSWNQRPFINQLRLGVGSPIAVGALRGSDQTLITLAPFLGNTITLYDGTMWRNYNGAPNGDGDISFDMDAGYSGTRTNTSPIITGLPDTTQLAVGMSVTGTGIPGSTVISTIDSATQITLNNNATASGTSTLTFQVPVSKNFDVFAFVDSGNVKLQIILWTNDTTRATAIDDTAETIIKSGDPTRRYLGTGGTNSVSAGQIPGFATGDRYCLLWNAYNRVLMDMEQRETTDSWAYTSATIRQARASTSNQFEVVVGLHDVSLISIDLNVFASGGVSPNVGIGEDSTTTFNAQQTGMRLLSTAMTGAKYRGRVATGRHIYSWNESGVASNTFFGDAGVTNLQSGMVGFMEA